jgi:hypothetical protein
MKSIYPTKRYRYQLLSILIIGLLTLSFGCETNSSSQPSPTQAETFKPLASTDSVITSTPSPAVFPILFAQWRFSHVVDLAWSPDSKDILISWGWSNDISNPDYWKYKTSLYDISTLEKIWETDEFGRNPIYQPDGKIIITADASLRSWDALTGKFIDTTAERGSGTLYFAFLTNQSQILLARSYLTGHETFNTNIGILDSAQKDLNTTIEQVGGLTNLVAAPDGMEFLTAFTNLKDSANSNMVFLWDLTTWRKKCSFPGDDGAFTPSGDVVVVVTREDGKISLYDRKNCKSLDTFDENMFISAFSISPEDGQLLAFGGIQGGSVIIMDMKSGELLYKLNENGEIIGKGFLFSPDGKFLSTVSYEEDENGVSTHTVRIWKIVP